MKSPGANIALLVTCSLFSGCHLRDRAQAAEKIDFHDNLKYATHTAAEFDLYTPREAAAPTPVVVFIHGGYWRNQSRSYYKAFTGLYQNFGIALATRGIATAVIDYRLFPEARLQDQIEDVIAASAFIKQNAAKYNIDPTQLFLSGHSAGGHLALAVLWNAEPQLARGAVVLSPILDIAHMRLAKDSEFNTSLTVPFFGSGENDQKYSPASYAGKNSKQALLLYGANDDAYLLEQKTKYEKQFATQGLTQIKFASIAGADHSTMVLHVNTSKDLTSDAIVEFVMKNKGGISHGK